MTKPVAEMTAAEILADMRAHAFADLVVQGYTDFCGIRFTARIEPTGTVYTAASLEEAPWNPQPPWLAG